MSASIASRVLIGAICGSFTVVVHHGIIRFCRKKAAKANLELLKELSVVEEVIRVSDGELWDYQEYCLSEIRIAIETNMTWGEEVQSIRDAIKALHTDLLSHNAKEVA
jgi:hypothetical protein